MMMLAKLKDSTAYKYGRRLAARYKEADHAAMSAQITYYLILAFFPFLFFLMNLLSFTPLPNRILIANFNAILPSETAALVKNILAQTVQAKSGTLLVLGMLGSLWAASRGMSAIIRGLNNAYGVKENRSFLLMILTELGATAGLTVMIILSFFTIVFGRIVGSYIFGLLGDKTLFYSIWAYVRYGISLAVMFATFLLIYKYLPNRRLDFRHIMVGTVFTTFGWIAASLLFSFYVNYFAVYEKVYGSLGAIFALIIWLYISTLVFLLGGELNAISSYFDEKGKR